MNIYDRQIAYRRKRLYIPALQLAMGSIGGQTAVAFNTAAYGIKLTATGVLEYTFPLPCDANPSYPLGFRLHWGAVGTPATMGNISWIALFILKKKGDALITAATGALDTPWTLVQAPPAANAQTYTSRGIRNANWALRSDIFDGMVAQFSVNLSAASGTIDSTNAAFEFGLEMDYMPMLTRFPHSEVDGPTDDASP